MNLLILALFYFLLFYKFYLECFCLKDTFFFIFWLLSRFVIKFPIISTGSSDGRMARLRRILLIILEAKNIMDNPCNLSKMQSEKLNLKLLEMWRIGQKIGWSCKTAVLIVVRPTPSHAIHRIIISIYML